MSAAARIKIMDKDAVFTMKCEPSHKCHVTHLPLPRTATTCLLWALVGPDMAKKKAATAASAPVSDTLPETNLEDSLHHNQDLSNQTPEADEGHSNPEDWRTFERVPNIPVKVRIKKPEKSECNCLSLTNCNDNHARA